jgi:hypothetical protein
MIVFVLVIIIIIIIIIIVIVDHNMCFVLCCAAGRWVFIYRLEQRCFHGFKEMFHSYVISNFYGVFKSNYEKMLATIGLLT